MRISGPFSLSGIANPRDSHHQREGPRVQRTVARPTLKCSFAQRTMCSRQVSCKNRAGRLLSVGIASTCFTQLSANTQQPSLTLWVGSCRGECFKLVKFLGSTAGSQQKQRRTSNKLRPPRSKDFLIKCHDSILQ